MMATRVLAREKGSRMAIDGRMLKTARLKPPKVRGAPQARTAPSHVAGVGRQKSIDPAPRLGSFAGSAARVCESDLAQCDGGLYALLTAYRGEEFRC